MGATKKTKARKGELWAELQDACNKFEKALFVNTDNVTSKQISIMRKGFRAIGCLMICGKNTMMKASINALNTAPQEDDEDYEERNATYEHKPHLEKIVGQLKGNTSIIFTNGDLLEIRDILDSQVREAPARVGSLAPKDVVIKAGPTGLDPKETSFF
jgi:large subunit ribosomal protein LP0